MRECLRYVRAAIERACSNVRALSNMFTTCQTATSGFGPDACRDRKFIYVCLCGDLGTSWLWTVTCGQEHLGQIFHSLRRNFFTYSSPFPAMTR